jgi:ABC-type lipoprotein release transport system permease subunit
LAEERVSFLDKLKQTINALSTMTTIMLLIFVSSIIILVFSSMVKSKRKVIATLLSLGYKKSQIAFSFATVSLIIGALPSLLGYLTGHFLQYAFIDIFSNY